MLRLLEHLCYTYCVLYAGWTKAPDGKRGVREYLTANRRVESFAAFCWVELPLTESTFSCGIGQ